MKLVIGRAAWAKKKNKKCKGATVTQNVNYKREENKTCEANNNFSQMQWDDELFRENR